MTPSQIELDITRTRYKLNNLKRKLIKGGIKPTQHRTIIRTYKELWDRMDNLNLLKYKSNI